VEFVRFLKFLSFRNATRVSKFKNIGYIRKEKTLKENDGMDYALLYNTTIVTDKIKLNEFSLLNIWSLV